MNWIQYRRWPLSKGGGKGVEMQKTQFVNGGALADILNYGTTAQFLKPISTVFFTT